MKKKNQNKKSKDVPGQQGLYSPVYEHDACGIGFVVNIKGNRSSQIISQALTVLNNLSHRGAVGADPNTGDGAGILFQVPHKFFQKVSKEEGFTLPEPAQYGVGMVFLPQAEEDRKSCQDLFDKVTTGEGQKVLGWRKVPTDGSILGKAARESEPEVYQVFIERNKNITDDLAFERKLYVIRKMTENALRYADDITAAGDFYVSSLSYKTIVYKGMLLSEQLSDFFPELKDPDMDSALALIHSRFSTNTFPSWDRAHPYRYIIHNGEINTLRGNENWMYAGQSQFESDLFGMDMEKVLPIVNSDGSDSSKFDNVLEFLSLTGRSLSHAMMMMIPEPWSKHQDMSPEKRAFYEYHSTLMEPWDGPASIGFTDGITEVGAVLDRNGLRPSRYYVTKDDLVVLASEVGVLDIAPENVLLKGRLEPGKMFLVDIQAGRIVNDEELKHRIATEHPYQEWLDKYLIDIDDLPVSEEKIPALPNHDEVLIRQQAFGYSNEDLRILIKPMAENGIEPLGAMGNDTPLAVLSEKPQLLFNYFKQLFAQVTNPPIDAIREELITGTQMYVGTEGNLINPTPESCRQIKLPTPLLSNEDLAKLRHIRKPHFKSVDLPILFDVSKNGEGLEKALQGLCKSAEKAIEEGANILILTDRGITKDMAAIPSLLAVSGLHHYLIKEEKRTQVALILESGEPREVHHFATLISFGVSAVNPYMAYESIADMIREGMIDMDVEKAVKNYMKASIKGVVKTISKMGISTTQSYCGAQIFEALGLAKDFVEKYFTWTASRIGGIGITEVSEEVRIRHHKAFPSRNLSNRSLEPGGQYQWRKDGEHHLFNPETIHYLQYATQTNDYELFKKYSNLIVDRASKLGTLRDLLQFNFSGEPVSLEEVESVGSICKRFKTGAMSYGSISKEAHEALAIAMNRIGGKSNTGEGGEDPQRYILLENGDSKNSAIKQVASGRFGVTSEYLVHAKELQIKMAQGAKPGEGGQLPGKKVYPWIAKVRHSTPGVGLISPPPHHDIYSIEDLAELIHDLKNANRDARINVKLVSEVGVGTIAAGVAKGHADVILISGYDGGTGASPYSSITHAGLPWELGLAETHQTLVMNDLRDRVVLETDGQLKTGRDVVIAALLGAEEFGFSTAPLVTLGCTMMRVCHQDTCPVGVATQNPELRKNFRGNPDYVVNFMYFIATEMREIMAELGFRTINEMVGRTDKLVQDREIGHWKTKNLDYSQILHRPDMPEEVGRYNRQKQDHGIEKTLDFTVLLDACKPALENAESVVVDLPIKNVNRVVGTILGSEVSKKYGRNGLPEDTIQLNFTGSAGQSFGAFIPKGITLQLEGDSNDYIGKGLSGGKIIVYPPREATFVPEENIIIGNVAFYGATEGSAYIRGLAGERFLVRNSGAHAVVEGVGDHGCEYMTGGRAVILGRTGRNFAAGMSGGVAYVLDDAGDFTEKHCNKSMVYLENVEKEEDIQELKSMIEKHLAYTNSSVAQRILDNWEDNLKKFIKVIPVDYKRMLEAIEEVTAIGLSGDQAIMAAFEQNKNDLARITGN
ncbi:MAG: glutamate synthase large subunit [Anaerolineales bacterium]|nr:glutamate synthase large subunit [Anaerolineales bacterium]